jgi:hypothetical protein
MHQSKYHENFNGLLMFTTYTFKFKYVVLNAQITTDKAIKMQ